MSRRTRMGRWNQDGWMKKGERMTQLEMEDV